MRDSQIQRQNQCPVYGQIFISNMESRIETLQRELQRRDSHILQLQAELLRVDYQYGVMVQALKKDLKQKSIQNQGLAESYQAKKDKYKKQIYRLQQQLNRSAGVEEKQEQKIYQLQRLVSNLQADKKRAQNLQQVVHREGVYIQNSFKKIEMRLRKSEEKCRTYETLCEKLQKQNAEIKKQLAEEQRKKSELEQWVSKEALDTPERVQLIKRQIRCQIDSCYTVEAAKAMQPSTLKSLNDLREEKQAQSLWESEIRKLKNCCDYGDSYIIALQTSQFDRSISKQVFSFIKSQVKERLASKEKLKEIEMHYEPIIAQLKKKICYFECQIQSIAIGETKTISYASVQTDCLPKSEGLPDHMKNLAELVAREKWKNDELTKVIDKFFYRELSFRKVICDIQCKSRLPALSNQILSSVLKPRQKLQKVLRAVYFVQLIKKKRRDMVKLMKRMDEKIDCADPFEHKIATLGRQFKNQAIQYGISDQITAFWSRSIRDRQRFEQSLQKLIKFYASKQRDCHSSGQLFLQFDQKFQHNIGLQ